MEPGDYDEISSCKILYFVRRTGLLAEWKTGKQNRSENGRGAWVALWAHPTHTDIEL
jgi:hypothetical protein